MEYTIPGSARIGHVHLKVADLERSIGFYQNVLGFEITTRYGTAAAFLSAGGYHHHIGLNTWHSKGLPPAQQKSVGLFHTAILFSSRKDLAMAVQRVLDARVPLTGLADHGVSEAVYLDDPDGNGIELYWDRPKTDWPIDEQGELKMYTRQLDLHNLLSEL